MTTEPTDAGLLPCPFCGSEEITISTTTHLTFTCLNCSCRLHGKANSAWNTRAASRLSRRPADAGVEEVISGIIQEIAELPDRTSPVAWPEAMLVTADELRSILQAVLVSPAATRRAALEEMLAWLIEARRTCPELEINGLMRAIEHCRRLAQAEGGE